jgi:hypothetical protein
VLHRATKNNNDFKIIETKRRCVEQVPIQSVFRKSSQCKLGNESSTKLSDKPTEANKKKIQINTPTEWIYPHAQTSKLSGNVLDEAAVLWCSSTAD